MRRHIGVRNTEEESHDANPDADGCKDLWVEVIKRAILDATFGNNMFSNYRINEDNITAVGKKAGHTLKVKALRWINSEKTHVGSLVWICETLGVKHTEVRDMVNSHVTDVLQTRTIATKKSPLLRKTRRGGP
jgi:hypothetical protein